jgi:diaminohydroxyphosphoribosylaminopyrimidine deaminase/5-amino-6-(5-phosphoribosylamino)uracil reductase
MTERQAMERALELALGGWGRVAPNPLVGAVLLRDGIVVGEGCHAEFGGAHAEVAALQQCDDARGATCVLNLEPCAHDAKTPPCTDALIDAGVRRVVYAVPDPDPVAGGGGERLKAAGIEVAWGLQRERAAALNAPFLWARCRADLPFVAVKVATSLDGFLADSDGRSRWISSEESRDWVHWLRAGFDALAVGRHTAVTDDPALTVRGGVAPRIPPTRVVFAGRGDLPVDLTLIATAHEVPSMIFVRAGETEPTRVALAGTGVTVHPADDLGKALRTLRGVGIESVLVEGGGTVVTALLEADLVDRLYWVQAPIWLGQGQRAFGDRTALRLGDVRAWTVIERRPLGPDTLLVLDRELCLLES